MISTESSEFFRGVVDVDLSVVTATSTEPNNNTKLASRHPILVELKGLSTGTGAQRHEQGDHTQVNNYHCIRPLFFLNLV